MRNFSSRQTTIMINPRGWATQLSDDLSSQAHLTGQTLKKELLKKTESELLKVYEPQLEKLELNKTVIRRVKVTERS